MPLVLGIFLLRSGKAVHHLYHLLSQRCRTGSWSHRTEGAKAGQSSCATYEGKPTAQNQSLKHKSGKEMLTNTLQLQNLQYFILKQFLKGAATQLINIKPFLSGAGILCKGISWKNKISLFCFYSSLKNTVLVQTKRIF